MKLALIRRNFSATGGAELYLQRLLAALAGAGHEIHLFAETWEQPPANVKLHAVTISGSRSQRPVQFAEAVEREMVGKKFDCVFSLERTLKQDVYRAGDGVHRMWLERRRQFAPWWKKPFASLGAFHRNMVALEARTFDPQNTRHIIVNSEMVKREIQKCFNFPAERIHHILNGVEVARFQSGKRAETRKRFGVKDNEFLLLFVGSGWERKGLWQIVSAINTMRLGASAQRMKLLVVGKGRKHLWAPSNVIFAGPMSDVENAYAAADLFISLPIYEPSSNAVCEALAARLPVVTSSQNGASELICKGVNGSVVENLSNPDIVSDVITFWAGRRNDELKLAPDTVALSLERNVAETLQVLELAAREKRK